jgi:hypothetical protein
MNLEVDRFFKTNILPPQGRVYLEIKREIDLAASGDSGSGFLAVLGLFAFTEYLGKIASQNEGSYTRQFKTFFRMMGTEYGRLLDSKDIDVYQMFRSGFVTSYFADECEVQMLKKESSSGIVIKPDGKYIVVVEKYFEDFMSACQTLYDDFTEEDDVWLPG